MWGKYESERTEIKLIMTRMDAQQRSLLPQPTLQAGFARAGSELAQRGEPYESIVNEVHLLHGLGAPSTVHTIVSASCGLRCPNYYFENQSLQFLKRCQLKLAIAIPTRFTKIRFTRLTHLAETGKRYTLQALTRCQLKSTIRKPTNMYNHVVRSMTTFTNRV